VSARATLVERTNTEHDGTVPATVVVVVGSVLLALRPLSDVTADTRVVMFGATYLTIGLASIAVPAGRDRPHMSPVTAFVVGVAAILLAGWIAGPAVPPPWSSAALPLSLLAAVAEEALFRRVAYARLERFGAVVAIAGSALLFGLVHVPAYGPAALPVDVGAGLLFGWQRWASGTWAVPAATHAFANAVVILR
jgi:membrane protease YdiL (CAAX protease family)